jgi:uncharacterized membrane protein
MDKINKAIILPVLAGVALIGKKLFGIEVSDAELNVLTDAILGAVTLVGIFMKPNK